MPTSSASSILCLAFSAALALFASSASAQLAWTPTPADNLQYQLSKLFNLATDTKANVHAYILDGFDTPATTVQALVAKGLKPVCYISAGSAEDWRDDFAAFPADALGAPLDGWPGEWWLDIRRTEVRNIMVQRMQMCKSKGFVAIDADNVDAYSNAGTGFPLSYADQLAYNTFLAESAHGLGLAIGLKNDLLQIVDLVGLFDFGVNEQCWYYKECGLYSPFVQAGKPVYNVEYSFSDTNFKTKVCPKAISAGIKSMKKRMSLDAWRLACSNA